jgi:hypothetical protein
VGAIVLRIGVAVAPVLAQPVAILLEAVGRAILRNHLRKPRTEATVCGKGAYARRGRGPFIPPARVLFGVPPNSVFRRDAPAAAGSRWTRTRALPRSYSRLPPWLSISISSADAGEKRALMLVAQMGTGTCSTIVDARYEKLRENGVFRPRAVLVAIGVDWRLAPGAWRGDVQLCGAEGAGKASPERVNASP